MSRPPASNLALIVMIIWYAGMALLTGGLFLLGLMFGSEVYREGSMPLAEWARIAGPFLATAAFFTLSMWFWSNGKHRASIRVCAASVIVATLYMFLNGALYV
ncbi:MAG: hypothetical protein SXU28_06695 [Pseudomonadota bacterium]|nr:hypothetical protein [Pseudomonadota bacterium]